MEDKEFEFYVLDTETASLSGGIVEIAWLRLNEKLDILDQFVSRVNPERPIEPGAMAIHGITDEECVGKPTIAEIAKLLPEPIMLAAHNAPFDIRMVSPHIEVAGSLCSLSLSRQFIKGSVNHKLPTLKTFLALSDQHSHSALGDVLTVRDLLLHILPLTGKSLEQLFTLHAKPKVVHKMAFGKHKGELTVNVPVGYRDWMLKQDGIDKDIRYTFTKMKGII